jgi:hypothetical protein
MRFGVAALRTRPISEFDVRFVNLAGMIAVVAPVVATGPADGAQLSTECSPNGLCYCVSDDLKSTIATRVEAIRARIATQRQQGKAIGYLSIPISTVAGAYLPVNAEVAAATKARVERRFGSASLWLLNTAAKEFALPGAASGADYMLMWTRVLEGGDGLGRDFDLVYFTGPSDFGQYFSFDGRADMAKLEKYYDGHARADAGLRAINKTDFRNYYALRASVSFSLGSHDEWNIIRTINEKRRASKDDDDGFGVAKQIAVLFNGTGIAPGLFDAPTQAGDEGKCPLPK